MAKMDGKAYMDILGEIQFKTEGPTVRPPWEPLPAIYRYKTTPRKPSKEKPIIVTKLDRDAVKLGNATLRILLCNIRAERCGFGGEFSYDGDEGAVIYVPSDPVDGRKYKFGGVQKCRECPFSKDEWTAEDYKRASEILENGTDLEKFGMDSVK